MPHAQLQSEEKYKQMTETPIPKLILRLGIPTIASMLITSVYNMTDTYFVGQLGKSASGAIGIVFSLMAIFQASALCSATARAATSPAAWASTTWTAPRDLPPPASFWLF